MTYPSTICRPALERLFHQNPPNSILAIGEHATDALGDWQTKARVEFIAKITDADALTALDLDGKYDVAFVTHTLEGMEKTKAEQLVATLRDRLAHRVFILLPIGSEDPEQKSDWALTDMTALGLRQVACFEHQQRPVHLYRFDLYDYKLTPDWLNPRFWANPEMWDRARW